VLRRWYRAFPYSIAIVESTATNQQAIAHHQNMESLFSSTTPFENARCIYREQKVILIRRYDHPGL